MIANRLAWREPADALGVLAGRGVAWLDSSGKPSEQSRFSVMAVDPFRVVRAESGRVTVDGAAVELGPLEALAAELDRWRDSDRLPVPFAGGAIGFMGYELGASLERVPRHRARGLGVPDMAWGFYDLVLAFDHAERCVWLFSSGLPRTGPDRARRAEKRADWLSGLLMMARPTVVPPPVPRLTWRRETSRARYEAAVERVRCLIGAGDIYQANVTTRFLARRPAGLDPADIHLALRSANPAPFGAYLECGPSLTIASASPERFLQLDADGRIESRPIKGTRPRGATPEEDLALAAALRESAKDGAENLMIVDLLRNDIGRVAAIGSVTAQVATVESFESVHHLVSVVEGRLRRDLGAVDLLRAAFPGGSVTGAPKIRAMEIIADIEDAPRGPYCGTIGWIGWDGAMDSSIVIRTVVVTPEMVVAQAGGGIVWDSAPSDEYAEMMVKIRPILRALGDEPA